MLHTRNVSFFVHKTESCANITQSITKSTAPLTDTFHRSPDPPEQTQGTANTHREDDGETNNAQEPSKTDQTQAEGTDTASLTEAAVAVATAARKTHPRHTQALERPVAGTWRQGAAAETREQTRLVHKVTTLPAPPRDSVHEQHSQFAHVSACSFEPDALRKHLPKAVTLSPEMSTTGALAAKFRL